jgi:HD domain
MQARDLALWRAARPWLDVRSNDEHTLMSYALAQALLDLIPDADEAVVLPAILLHDTGWKQMPQDKLALAVGPKAQFPELQRDHEIAGVAIGQDILARLNLGLKDAEILAIIDGHDTTKQARSVNDAVMKDADKLWRFTAHGRHTIGGWFGSDAKDTLAMLQDFVLPSFLTPQGRAMAGALLAEGLAMTTLTERMKA